MLRPEPRPAVAVEGDHHARAGASAPRAARPRCRPRPGASPPPPPRSRPRAACGGAGGLGGEQDARLGLLAVAVQEVELVGHLAPRASSSSVSSSSRRGVGPLQPPRGVDPRRRAGSRARCSRALPGSTPRPPSARAGPACAVRRERHEALAHDAPVLAAQRHEVADRGERREVEVLGRVAPGRGRRPRRGPRASFGQRPAAHSSGQR